MKLLTLINYYFDEKIRTRTANINRSRARSFGSSQFPVSTASNEEFFKRIFSHKD